MRIEIAEIDKQGRFDVWHDGELICDSTLTPLCSAARVLLSRGIDPGIMLEKTRRGSDRVDMRAHPSGLPPGLVVNEGDHAPRFAKLRPFPGSSPPTVPEPATELCGVAVQASIRFG
jgi:hypothetical protein